MSDTAVPELKSEGDRLRISGGAGLQSWGGQ
jgi:hypothetical protein